MITYQDFSLIRKETEFFKRENKLDSLPYAFMVMILEKFFPEINNPLEQITDGQNDLSIDAYFIDENKKTINLFQFKHTDIFETANRKDGIKEKEISDFILKLEAIWNKDKNYYNKANYKMKEAINEIWNAFENGYSKTNIYFISNFSNTINDNNKKDAVKILEEKFRAKFISISLPEIIDSIVKKNIAQVDIKMQLKGKNYFEESTGNIRALIAEVNALNFLKSILNEKEELNENVFNENVRVYLRANTKINKQIYDSIKSESNYKFFYYNNGITAICDSFTHNNSDSPLIELENFQIVNGGQTTHSLYNAFKNNLKDKINDIYLLLRIYEVKKDRNIGQEIARFTNTQNPVKNRDIMSNDLIQIKIQKELERMGFFYERKKYEFRDKEVNADKKIDAERIGQAMLSFYVDKPGSAKNKKQEIFGDFYNDIFDEQRMNGNYVLLPYLLYKKIEEKIKEFRSKIKTLLANNKEEELEKYFNDYGFLDYAHYYILFTLKVIAEKNNISLTIKNGDIIFNYYDEAINIIKKIIEDDKKLNIKFSLPYVFKTDDLVEKIKRELV
ncbi:MAG: AIPR family protein [Patescibacteria group bacterium]